jgi:hypothetical protein
MYHLPRDNGGGGSGKSIHGNFGVTVVVRVGDWHFLRKLFATKPPSSSATATVVSYCKMYDTGYW